MAETKKSTPKQEKGNEDEKVPIPLKVVKGVVESPFAKEFAEFINRGSIVDLAIGVAVGGAFTSIVKSLVDDIVMPVTSLLAGGLDFTKLSIDVPNVFGANTTAHIAYGNFLQNVVNFLAIAFTVFLIVRMINRLNAKRMDQFEVDAEKAVKAAVKTLEKEKK